MNASRIKAMRRTFETWVKLNNYPKEKQKTLWKSFKKRYKENCERGKERMARTVSKRRRNRAAAVTQP